LLGLGKEGGEGSLGGCLAFVLDYALLGGGMEEEEKPREGRMLDRYN